MEIFGHTFDLGGLAYAAIIFLSLRYRDKVLDGLPKWFDGIICSAGVSAGFILPFKESLFKQKPIETYGIILGVFILAGLGYFIATKKSKDPRKKQKGGESLNQLICDFVAEYESKKPIFHNKEKNKYLSASEKHEKKFNSIFNSNVLPEISKKGITIPHYMLDQRRWSDIRNLVLKKLGETISEA